MAVNLKLAKIHHENNSLKFLTEPLHPNVVPEGSIVLFLSLTTSKDLNVECLDLGLIQFMISTHASRYLGELQAN